MTVERSVELTDLVQDADGVIATLRDTGGVAEEARARHRLNGSGWVLIRPDQVVAARGDGHDLAALTRYLDRVVRVRDARAGDGSPVRLRALNDA